MNFCLQVIIQPKKNSDLGNMNRLGLSEGMRLRPILQNLASKHSYDLGCTYFCPIVVVLAIAMYLM